MNAIAKPRRANCEHRFFAVALAAIIAVVGTGSSSLGTKPGEPDTVPDQFNRA